jgi:membrane protein involved in colicin uptake
MKKIVTLLTVASVALFYACGPSAEEKALKEKAKNDSIAAAEAKAKAEQDSLANVMLADSLADAKRVADSLANLPKGGGTKKTTTPTKTKDEKNLDQIKNDRDTKAPTKEDKQNLDKIKNDRGK